MTERSLNKVKLTPPTFFAVFVQGTSDGPLSGRQGFLTQNGKALFFAEEERAKQKVADIQNRCVNRAPVVSLTVVPFPSHGAFVDVIESEVIAAFDLKPEFDPLECQAKSFVYGNTGGGCMVGTVSFYIPDLNKNVWVNCSGEGVTITATDFVWNEDHSNSAHRYDDVLLFDTLFCETEPKELGAWLPLVKETLCYTMEQELNHRGHLLTLPPQWQQLVSAGQAAQSQSVVPPEMTCLC